MQAIHAGKLHTCQLWFCGPPQLHNLSSSRVGLQRRQIAPVAAVAVEPAQKPTQQRLSKADLVQYIASGCKPRDRWGIGTEHEKLGYQLSDHRRLTYEQIRQILEALCKRHGWKPMMEQGLMIGAELAGQTVTLEPGGQFELSGAPVSNLHLTDSEVNSHLFQVTSIAKEFGLAFLDIGFDPKWLYDDVPKMPKQRYRIMRDYMPKRGKLGHDMMFRSCTIQVNLDYESEEDMVQKARIGLALQPVATALFANSPFREGRPTGFRSWRSHVWTDVDPDRTGILPFVFEEGFGFDRYVEYALDVPVYFVYKDGNYLEATGGTFRDFLQGELNIVPGEYPSMDDWVMHLTTIFPEIRLKKFIEMRGADGGPQEMIVALSALWVGLLYDSQTQSAAYDLIKDWTSADHEHLRATVPELALKAPFRDGTVQDLAKKVLALSRQGLEARDLQEAKFLQPLEEIAESGLTCADRLLAEYSGTWGKQIDNVYSAEHTF